MACFHPLKGWRARSGKVTFSRKDGWSDLPPAIVACGQCSGCRLERSRQWAVRLSHENKLHDASCFLTLTYDDEHLPRHPAAEFDGPGCLQVEDWQNFAKRLRHRMGKFRFYHCGEYGSKEPPNTHRPHLHCILFGLDFAHDRKFHHNEEGHPLFTSQTLDEVWQNGNSTIGSVTFESCAYVARYIMKKQTGEQGLAEYERCNPETGEVYQLKPPYTTMSRRPGIGHDWFEKYQSDYYPSDQVIINAQKTRPPTYYDTQLDLRNPSLLAEIKQKRVNKARKHYKEQTPERLAVRERVQKARTAFLQREHK